ncbi:MAG: histidine kinase dimerization/phospho-acceptor domain-containing protein [Gammaproteobacteria bacterium]|nr:histidine kinase dimerization/phospho-acceptor domain-containing protein [Gammaproteobacteria bacterium]
MNSIPDSFQTIVENLPNGVNLCDLEGRILNTNPSMLSIMQADHASQLVGKRLKEFLLPHCHPLYEACLVGALSGEAKLLELDALSLSAESLCLESHLLPLRDAQNQVTHFLSLIYDRTQGKKNAALAWQRQAQLEHVSRLSLLGELTSGLAHEINQPLAAIINYVKGCERRLQRDECSMEEILAALDQVCQQAERASNIVKQVRQFARKGSTSGNEAVDLHEVLRESLSLLEVDRTMHKVEVISSLAKNLPVVTGDRLQLEQVMINLLRNAMEAISAVGGRSSGGFDTGR